jgi:Cu/Ag efflux protein CusF
MNRAAALFAAGLATLLLSGPAIAADRSGSSAATTPSTAPAEKPGMMAIPHNVTGSVVSVDKSTNRVSIRDTKGKELTLVANRDTAAELARLKPGDQVKATYKKSHDQLVMTKISDTAAERRSSESTAEQTSPYKSSSEKATGGEPKPPRAAPR